MILVFRLLLFALIIFLIYRAVVYIISPKRKLEHAHELQKFFFLDDPGSVQKNFEITYHGVLFEGEKYLGTTDQAFEFISIFIWPKNPAALKGMQRKDFLFIESEIKKRYPEAAIDWKSPVKEFLKE